MSGSHNHGVKKIGPDHYRLSWEVDRRSKSVRYRLPTRHTRDTDEAGAKRFAKKWGCEVKE